MDCSIIPDGQLFFFKICLKFSTSKWNKVQSEPTEKQRNNEVSIKDFLYTAKSCFSINKCFKLLVMTYNSNVQKREKGCHFLLQMYILDIQPAGLYNLQNVKGVFQMRKNPYRQHTFCSIVLKRIGQLSNHSFS